MKFTCEKNALVSAISVASRTVAQKSTIPALEGIYIRAGVKLTLSGYNLETGITISVDADIQETGACIMPSRLFFDIIRKLPDDTVSISVDENFKVSIRGGISFRNVGFDYIRKFREKENVRGVRVIFVTAPEADYPGLRAQARKVTDITRSLSTILDGIPTDCDSCGLREICDAVEGMRELHFQQAGKKSPSE